MSNPLIVELAATLFAVPTSIESFPVELDSWR
jgi:hypothetical protein